MATGNIGEAISSDGLLGPVEVFMVNPLFMPLTEQVLHVARSDVSSIRVDTSEKQTHLSTG